MEVSGLCLPYVKRFFQKHQWSAFLWVGFRWCNSQDSLKLMVFSGDFLDVLPSSTRPFIDTLMFGYIKGVQVMHISAEFHYVWFVVLELGNFHTSRKYNFRFHLGGFLDVTH